MLFIHFLVKHGGRKMKKIIYLILFPFLFISCSNNGVIKNNAEAWVKTNVLPYFENSSIDTELTQIVKIKNQIQCNERNKILIGSYTTGSIFSMFSRGLSEQDSSLIDFASRLKIVANSQEKALSYNPEYTYISVYVNYKNKYMDNGHFSYLVVVDKNNKVLNCKIVKEYREDLKMNVYLTEE